MQLSALCTVKVNFPEADFWLTRRGSLTAVGKPTRSFYKEHIGIKVLATDILYPDYLYWVFVALHEQGFFKPIAYGSLPLVHIRVSDIKQIRFG